MVTNGVYGWSFELVRPITVTGLAWFDQNADGLSHSHEIGIWQDTSSWPAWATNYVAEEPTRLRQPRPGLR